LPTAGPYPPFAGVPPPSQAIERGVFTLFQSSEQPWHPIHGMPSKQPPLPALSEGESSDTNSQPPAFEAAAC